MVTKLSEGMDLPTFSVERSDGQPFTHEDLAGGLFALTFYRYVTCPVCNDHIAHARVHNADIEAAGVKQVAVFHSPAAKLERYLPAAEVPFPLLADPEFRLYELFGVQARGATALDPRSMLAGMSAMTRVRTNPFDYDGTASMLPANFMVYEGKLLRAHYGRFIGDVWSPKQVVEYAAEDRRRLGLPVGTSDAAE